MNSIIDTDIYGPGNDNYGREPRLGPSKDNPPIKLPNLQPIPEGLFDDYDLIPPLGIIDDSRPKTVFIAEDAHDNPVPAEAPMNDNDSRNTQLGPNDAIPTEWRIEDIATKWANEHPIPEGLFPPSSKEEVPPKEEFLYPMTPSECCLFPPLQKQFVEWAIRNVIPISEHNDSCYAIIQDYDIEITELPTIEAVFEWWFKNIEKE